MATSYEESKSEVKENLTGANSTLDQSVQNRIEKLLNTNKKDTSVEVVSFTEAAPTKTDVLGNDVVTFKSSTTSDVITVSLTDLSKAEAKDLAAIKALVFEGTDKVVVDIDSKSFAGVIVLDQGAGDIDVGKTTKAVAVETGAGNDSVTTGTGQDSIVLSAGNDSINTGAGSDKLVVKTGFSGNAVIDGGKGADVLDLSALDIKGWTQGDAKGQYVITLENGAKLDLKGVEKLVYDFNGDGSIGRGETITIGVKTLTKLLGEDDAS